MKKNNNLKKELQINVYKNFKEFESYINTYVFDSIYKDIVNSYDKNCRIGEYVYFIIEFNNRINKYLCELSINNIDLQILLVEKHIKILDTILRQRHINISNNEKETILLNAIETYNGDKVFSLHILDCLKKTMKKDIDIKPLSLDEIVQKYLNDNLIKTDPNYLEHISKILNIIDFVIDEDKEFKNFIYLKYGYFNEKYFSLNDISKILNIDMSKCLKYYQRSLNLLKQISVSSIDKVIAFEDNKSNMKLINE